MHIGLSDRTKKGLAQMTAGSFGYCRQVHRWSMIGMAALSSMIAVSLVMSARLLTSFTQALQLVVGSVAIGIGSTAIYSMALAG
ncbi:hypothetical protein [Bradyrhizobium sp. 5.13L]